MSEPKSFAALSSGLLARKGQARPAMRPRVVTSADEGAAMPGDELGWNDMGFDLSEAAELEPAVLAERRQLSQRLATAVNGDGTAAAIEDAGERTAPVATATATVEDEAMAVSTRQVSVPTARRLRREMRGRGGAFTLRLDSERRLRLKLASKLAGRSAQALMSDALDRLLASMPDVERLADASAEQEGAAT